MHIIAMLALVIAGYAAGENFSWLLGLPLICAGLYVGFGGRGGKSKAAKRYTSENIFFLIGLLFIPVFIISELL